MLVDFSTWTEKDFIREFRKMWNWMASATEVTKCRIGKTDYLQARFFPGYEDDDVLNNCFLCEYSRDGEFADCNKCPINWGYNEDFEAYLQCDDEGALYHEWWGAPWQEAAELARKIANLPEK